jgi:flagellar biosynthesis/type III secretory pathway protein FliH
VSERQQRQLVDVLRAWQAAYPHVVVRNPDGVDQFAEEVALIVESQLAAAERAGYERGQAEDAAILEFGEAVAQARREGKAEGYEWCKQDAATAIKAAYVKYPTRPQNHVWADQFLNAALAALAALNATQQEASDG